VTLGYREADQLLPRGDQQYREPCNNYKLVKKRTESPAHWACEHRKLRRESYRVP